MIRKKNECMYRWGWMLLFSQFTAPKLGEKINKKKGSCRRAPATGGHYTATLWNTLEGTAKRAEKDRERLSGSTHASPSSKFCA